MTMLLLLTHDLNGAAQCVLAVGIEIGVRLIEHDQEGVAEHGARQANSLALPCRERHAALADPRRISFRQAQNEVVHARDLRRLQDRVGTGVLGRSGRCFPQPYRRTKPHPEAGSRYGARDPRCSIGRSRRRQAGRRRAWPAISPPAPSKARFFPTRSRPAAPIPCLPSAKTKYLTRSACPCRVR